MNGYTLVASFLGTGVEFVEALTIILAVGTIRGYRSALFGALCAVGALAGLTLFVGAPLVLVMQLPFVQGLVGVLLLLFGIRWLRKAIMRYAGLTPLHDEAASYRAETERQKQAGAVRSGIDRFGFGTAFGGTFLEGLEAVFIVLTFGATARAIGAAVLGALLALVVVFAIGMWLRRPLTSVPENTMKYVVGVMLTSFGAFFFGESLGADWPQADLSIVYMAVSFLLLTVAIVAWAKNRLNAVAVKQSELASRGQ